MADIAEANIGNLPLSTCNDGSGTLLGDACNIHNIADEEHAAGDNTYCLDHASSELLVGHITSTADKNEIHLLLECGISPDTLIPGENYSSLLYIIKHSNHPDRFELARDLINHGANLFLTDNSGMNVFDHVIKHKDQAMLDNIISALTNRKPNSNDDLLIYHIAYSMDKEAISNLLASGESPDIIIPGEQHSALLHIMKYSNHPDRYEVIKNLIKHGANYTAVDGYGNGISQHLLASQDNQMFEAVISALVGIKPHIKHYLQAYQAVYMGDKEAAGLLAEGGHSTEAITARKWYRALLDGTYLEAAHSAEAKENQYTDSVRSSDGILLQFTIAANASLTGITYVISDNHLLVGRSGLSIINYSPAARIVFQSDNEHGIILLGEINIYNHQADLVFIAPSIYCDGCSFAGTQKVTFSTIPSVANLSGPILDSEPIKYSNGASISNNVYIGFSGLLAKDVSVSMFSGLIKAAGPVNVADIVLQANYNVDFSHTIWSGDLQVQAKSSLLFKDLYLSGYASVIAYKWQITGKSSIKGDCSFKGGTYFISATQPYFIGGNLDILFTEKATLERAAARGNITVTGDHTIDIGSLLSTQIIKVQSKGQVLIYSLAKANGAVQLISNSNIIVPGVIESAGTIDINSHGFSLHGKMHARQGVNIKVEESITSDKGGARLFSQGTLAIQNHNNGPIKSMHIKASNIEVVGNALIKTDYLHLQRNSNYKITTKDIPAVRNHNHHDHKWKITMSCYKEMIEGDLGTEAKLIIAGDLTYEGKKIDNELSRLVVGGSRYYIGQEPAINSALVKLHAVANFDTWGRHGTWPDEARKAARSRIMQHCGVETGGAARGPISQQYNSITSVINMEHSANALGEIEQSNIVEVVIEEIEAAIPAENKVQKSFTDRSTAGAAAKGKVYETKCDVSRNKPSTNFTRTLDFEDNYDDEFGNVDIGKEETDFSNDGQGHSSASSAREKSEERLWQEIMAMNPKLAHETISKIKQVLAGIKDIEAKKGIKNWQGGDILNWHVDKDKVKDNLAEVMAVIKTAVKLSSGFYPRTVQMIAALLLYYGEYGRLIEVGTGEGKSIIVGIFTIIKALEGHKNDITTSSPVLAKRDAGDQEKLYSLFGLNSGECISGDFYQEKPCYRKKVIYGTAHSFIADLIYQESSGKNTRSSREHDIMVIDEEDNIFIDQSTHIVMLSHPLPRFEYLEPLLFAVWWKLGVINDQFYYENGKLMWADYKKEKDTYVKFGEREVTNKIEFAREKLTDFFSLLLHTRALREGEIELEDIKIPTPLRDFAKNHVDSWVNSALLAAYSYEYEKDYTFVRRSDGDEDIAPLDRRNTGVTQDNMRLSNGLHQFLQAKHYKKMSPETLVIDFMSNKAFFEGYKARIYGLSATTGTEEDISLLNKFYGVDAVLVPSFTERVYEEYRAIIANDFTWENEVTANTVLQSLQGRAVILIAETAQQAASFADQIKQYFNEGVGLEPKIAEHLKRIQITLYNKNSPDEEPRKWLLDAGDIVISTTLASRGTHFATTEFLRKNGGAHLILSYLPDNPRSHIQIDGRVSRQGEPGSAQLIINIENTLSWLEYYYPWYNISKVNDIHSIDIKEIIEWRNLAYQQEVLRSTLCEMPMQDLKDNIYREFNRLKNKFRNSNEDEDLKQNAEVEQLREDFGKWFKEQEKVMACNITDKLDRNSDFTARNQNIAQQVKASYRKFEEDILGSRHDSIIKNPTYLIIRGLHTNSLADIERARELDTDFSFAADYAMAKLLVDKNDKEGVKRSLQSAKDNIRNVILPLYFYPLALLGSYNKSDYSVPLAAQFRDKINIALALLENIDMNLQVIEYAQSSDELYLVTENVIKLPDILPDYEYLSDEANEFGQSGIRHFYEFGVIYVPEKEDLFGNFLSIALSLFQIGLGLVVPGAGVFISSLRASMVVGGIKDTLFTSIATLQGKAVSPEQVLWDKAINVAVSVITAGVHVVTDKLGVAGNLGLSTESKTSFQTELLRQSMTTAASALASNTLKLGLHSYREEIQEDIRQQIHATLMEHESELMRLIKHDEWTGRSKAREILIGKGNAILADHRENWRQVHQKILRGVAGNIPLFSAGLTGFEMVETPEKHFKMYVDLRPLYIPVV